jgi:hypothetical protein
VKLNYNPVGKKKIEKNVGFFQKLYGRGKILVKKNYTPGVKIKIKKTSKNFQKKSLKDTL